MFHNSWLHGECILKLKFYKTPPQFEIKLFLRTWSNQENPIIDAHSMEIDALIYFNFNNFCQNVSLCFKNRSDMLPIRKKAIHSLY